MNILLLSNSAPNYFHFFNALAKRFNEDGSRIFVAVDSAFSRDQNQLDALGFPIYEFSEFFANHKIDPKLLEQYAHYNLNAALLSDFERAQVYGLWGDIVGIDYLEKLKSALLAYFQMIFEKHKIDLVLYENVSNAFAHFALFVAQEQGAKYCGIGASRLPGRFVVTSDPLRDNATEKAFADIRNGKTKVSADIRKWATQYIQEIETIVPDYMKTNGSDRVSLIHRYAHTRHIAKIFRLVKYMRTSRQAAFQIANPPLTHWKLFLRNVKRRLRTIVLKKHYKAPVGGEKFLLYPLHFHPESSTSILAGTYLDEYEVIRNIAFNLPQGIRLYVKDHISAWAYPSNAFYRKLRQLPNVRLLAPTAPTKQLIKASQGVITLTSTMGYEALLMNRPVFLFGRVFYEFHKGVQRIEDPTKIYELLRYHLENKVVWDEQYNQDFVCAYHASTLTGTLNLIQTGQKAQQSADHIYAIVKSGINSGKF